MRRLWVAVLATVLLLTFAAGAWAAPTMDDLANQVKQLQDALKQALDRIQKLEAEKAAVPAVPSAPTAPATQPAAKPTPHWYDNVQVTGYWQARYQDPRFVMKSSTPPGAFDPAAKVHGKDEFLIRRAYLTFIARPNDRTTGILSLRRAGQSNQFVDVESMYLSYALGDLWNIEFGRVPNKFGWDAWESSSKRLPFDRFAGAERYAPAGVRGVYFGSPTDNGVYLIRKSDGAWTPTVYLGLVNGQFMDSELNGNKSVSIDLKWKQDCYQWGFSWLDGEYTEPVGTPPHSMTTLREAFDVFFHRDPTPWGFQGEYIQGRLFGQGVNGFYGQVARTIGKYGTAYARYEQWDPSEDVCGDLFDAWRLGYAWQMDNNSELTLEYMAAERGNVPVGAWGLQWQFGF